MFLLNFLNVLHPQMLTFLLAIALIFGEKLILITKVSIFRVICVISAFFYFSVCHSVVLQKDFVMCTRLNRYRRPSSLYMPVYAVH